MHTVKQCASCKVWSVETFGPEEQVPHTHTNRCNFARAQFQLSSSTCLESDMFSTISLVMLIYEFQVCPRYVWCPVQPTIQARHPWHPKARFLGPLENGALSNHPCNMLTYKSSVLHLFITKTGMILNGIICWQGTHPAVSIYCYAVRTMKLSLSFVTLGVSPKTKSKIIQS